MQVLLTNPESDVLLYYLSVWTEEILKQYGNNKYYRLKRQKVTRKNFESILSKRSVDLVLLCGHGAENRIRGDNGEIILDLENSALLENKNVHALSCKSAKVLGKDSIEKGAISYIGYKEDFVAIINHSNKLSRPLEDETAALFLDAAFTAPKVLSKGGSAKEAVAATKKAYDESIRKAINSDIQSDNDQFISWLFWDRDNLVSC